MKESVTIKVNHSLLEDIKNYYSNYLVNNNGEYVYFMAKKLDLVITGYVSSSSISKVTFIGENALKEAKKFDESATLNEKKKQIKEEWICLDNQIGSDEVGVGDFFLPMIVVASFVRKKDIKTLIEYNIHDSKKLTDTQILDIGERIANKVFYSKLTLSNEKYNELILKGENLNSIKAKMHNRALLNMFKQFPDTRNIFIDEFVNKEKYFSYLNDKNEIQIKNLTFKTKGESYYPSIALASVLARYAFLKEKESLDNKYKVSFPFGAGKSVDEFAIKFIEKYGKEELNKLVKQNFKNYTKL